MIFYFLLQIHKKLLQKTVVHVIGRNLIDMQSTEQILSMVFKLRAPRPPLHRPRESVAEF